MQHIISVAFDFIYRKRWIGCAYEKDNPEPLRKMVENNVRDIIVKHRDQIIDMAASKLAESLRRSKAVKEAVGYVLDENM